MEQRDIVHHALTALGQLELSYCVVGSFGSMAYGEPRMTQDLDVVVDMPVDRISAFCSKFPDPDWYVSREAVTQAVWYRESFNVLHTPSGTKIDVMVAKTSAWAKLQLSRRQRVFVLPELEAFVAHPEDVILGKLLYYREGGSDKHLRDIAGMLDVSGHLIDPGTLREWAANLGL